MRLRARVATAAATVIAASWPLMASACAVCQALGNERSRKAFFDMTIFMSVTPLGLIGWGLAWLGFRGRKLLKAEFEERPDATGEGEGGAKQ